jgi:glycine oxidase
MSLKDGQPKKVAVVGAGICGSLTAWYGQQLGFEVHIYEPDNQKKSCSFTAAGMLAPMAELESAEQTVYQLGMQSLALWPKIIKELENCKNQSPIFYRDNGTLVVSHRQDDGVFNQFFNSLKAKLSTDFSVQCELMMHQTLEPELKPLGTSLYLKNEAQVDAHQALRALHTRLQRDSHWHWQHAIDIGPNHVDGEKYDWVFDCRGLAAAHDIPGLHGVRGEVIMVNASQVTIQHMVRIMHPRYRIYIVPRENGNYMIGATEIQSDDTGPISVRSTLELLSAAFSVHSGFAEARILSMDTNARPAMFNHLPYIEHKPGLTRINGLYRHGYLLAPAVVAQAFKELGLDPMNLNKTEQADSLSEVENEDCI